MDKYSLMDSKDITTEELEKAKRKLLKKTKQLQKYEKLRKAKQHIRDTVAKENANLHAEDHSKEDKDLTSSCRVVTFRSGSPDVIILDNNKSILSCKNLDQPIEDESKDTYITNISCKYEADQFKMDESRSKELKNVLNYQNTFNEESHDNKIEICETMSPSMSSQEDDVKEVFIKRRINTLKVRRQKFSPETSNSPIHRNIILRESIPISNCTETGTVLNNDEDKYDENLLVNTNCSNVNNKKEPNNSTKEDNLLTSDLDKLKDVHSTSMLNEQVTEQQNNYLLVKHDSLSSMEINPDKKLFPKIDIEKLSIEDRQKDPSFSNNKINPDKKLFPKIDIEKLSIEDRQKDPSFSNNKINPMLLNEIDDKKCDAVCHNHSLYDLNNTFHGEVLATSLTITRDATGAFHAYLLLLHQSSFSLWTEDKCKRENSHEWQCVSNGNLDFNFATDDRCESAMGVYYTENPRFVVILSSCSCKKLQFLFIEYSFNNTIQINQPLTYSLDLPISCAVVSEWSIAIYNKSSFMIHEFDPIYSHKLKKWSLNLNSQETTLPFSTVIEEIMPLYNLGELTGVLICKDRGNIYLYDTKQKEILREIPLLSDEIVHTSHLFLAVLFKNIILLCLSSIEKGIVVRMINPINEDNININVLCCNQWNNMENDLGRSDALIIDSTLYLASSKGKITKMKLPKS